MLESVATRVRESISVQTALVGMVVMLAAYQVTRRRYKLPPGPTSLPLLGNMLSFRKLEMYQKLLEWAKTYGPVCTVYLGPIRCIVLNNIEVTLEAMVKKGSDFAGRISSYSGDMLSEGGKDIALSDYGPIWKIHRRVASKALRNYMAGRSLEKNVQGVLKQMTTDFGKQKGPFDPTDDIFYAVANMLNGVCFSKHFHPEDPIYKKIKHMMKDQGAELGNGFLEDIIPPLRLYPTERFRKLKASADEFYALLAADIENHKATLDPNNLRDLVDMLLVVQQEERTDDSEALSDVYIRQIVSDVFGAGIDTTRMTLIWIIYHLAKYPDIQKRCQEEVDAALGDRQTLQLSDRTNLCYTEATLHESMRVCTVAPLGVPHKTTRDTSVGGYEIPAGTMVLINHYALHHDPAHWPEPEQFRPERFLEASGKLAPKPESWLPFSAGHRNCLGEGVARPELHLLLAGLLREFTFSLPQGEPDQCKATGGGFTYIPQNMRILATPRR